MSRANAEWWTHVPTTTSVTIDSATISLPFLTNKRTTFLEGEPTTRLDSFRSSAPFTVAADVIAGATATFDLPGPLAIRRSSSRPARAASPRACAAAASG